ncbi:MAG: helix-turn-helix domain-containing protein [Actinobacteria bacterium]|nr:helix-turn-helix domain-containing protein [Actinomycetota bacterium]
MFEIGNSLREARLRQGLDFPEVEQATKIRGKYLRALEGEQFDILPGQTYVKGFLRTYSEFLGLDGELYVDEYNSRYIPGDEETPLRARSTSTKPRRGNPRVESSVVLVALAAIGILTALVVVAWQFGSNTPNTAIPDFSSQPPAASPTTRTKRQPRQRTAAPIARFTATAALGDCWLEVHVGSAAGQQLFQGTVPAGRTVRFAQHRRLYVLIGRPGNLRVRLNGRRVGVPDRGSPTAVLVTAKRITAATA